MAPGVPNGHVPAGVTWPYSRCAGLLEAWRRLRPSNAFSTEHGVFRDTEIQTTISVTRKQFYDTCLQKYCFRNHFEIIKYKSLEHSEEHCSVVCKLFFAVSHLQKRALPLLCLNITHPAAVIPARCRIISWGTFYGLVVHPGSKLCHLFLSFAVFFDDCRCFWHHQVLEGDWLDHAADYVPRPCTLHVSLLL